MAKPGAKAQSAEIEIDDRFRKGVGALLRATRVRLGEDIQDAASTLRIRRTYLESIEDGRFGDLPGLTYAIGFVRTYAEHLGLDGAEVVRRFKTEAQNMGADSDLKFPSPVQEGRVPGGALLFIALLIAVAAYGGWYYLSSQGKSVADLIPELPEKLASMMESVSNQKIADPAPITDTATEPASPVVVLPEPVEAVTPEPSVKAPETQTDADVVPTVTVDAPATPSVTVETPAVADSSSAVAPQAAPSGQTPPADQQVETPKPVIAAETPKPVAPGPTSEPAESPVPVDGATGTTGTSQTAATSEALPAPTTEITIPAPDPAAVVVTPSASEPVSAPAVAEKPAFGDQGSDVRIVLNAIQDSWIQVREANGDLVNAQLLRPGERYNVPNREGLVLLTGNAGGLQLLVDGKVAPSLGPQGAIRRNVPLDPTRLIAGVATTE